jgi:hypothetical protein
MSGSGYDFPYLIKASRRAAASGGQRASHQATDVLIMLIG